mmetsp:Transcript_60084/g.95200  ORF Transcript_60084/g.95200 Transcript_60084/m.95200 type:complete len:91 (+) Transcript_60084:112-384(+)
MSQTAASAGGLEEHPRRTGVSNARLLLRAMLSLETSKCGESSSLQRLSALCIVRANMPCFLANIGMMFAGMVTAMLALMSSGAVAESEGM